MMVLSIFWIKRKVFYSRGVNIVEPGPPNKNLASDVHHSDICVLARNKAIKAPISLYTQKEWVTKRALLDSGATESFIHLRLVKNLQMKKEQLKRPRKVKNVDGTIIQKVTNAVCRYYSPYEDECSEERNVSALQFCLALSRIYFRPLIR